jgi:tetratricopeptide (TPR) repeat protein
MENGKFLVLLGLRQSLVRPLTRPLAGPFLMRRGRTRSLLPLIPFRRANGVERCGQAHLFRQPTTFLVALLGLLMSQEPVMANQSPEQDSKIREHIQAGLEARQKNQLEKAAGEFEAITKLAPNFAEAYMNLGLVRHKQGKLEAAIEALQKALQLKRDLKGVDAVLGVDLLAVGRTSEAVNHLEKAFQADPSNVDINFWLGLAYAENNNLREAVERLEVARKSRPKDTELLYYLGRAYRNLSSQVYDELLRTGPDSARANQVMAESYALSGKLEDAVKKYRRVLEINPNLPGIGSALGDLYVDASDYSKAEEVYREELKLSPGNADLSYKYGAVLLKLGRSSEAIPHLEKAVISDPNLAEAHFQLGKAFSDEGNLDGAEKAWLKVIQLRPGLELIAPTHYQLAQLYQKQERNKEAEKELELFRKTQGEFQKKKARD